MRLCLFVLCSLLPFFCQAEIKQVATSPIKLELSGEDANSFIRGAQLVLASTDVSVRTKDFVCAVRMQTSLCKALTMDNKIVSRVNADTEPMVEFVNGLKAFVFQNPANRLVPGVDLIDIGSAICRAGQCDLTFNYGSAL